MKELHDVLQCDLEYVLFFDTGLNRLGIKAHEAPAIAELIDCSKVKYIISHLACSDIPIHRMNNEQYCEFVKLKQYFPNAKFGLSASFGCFVNHEFVFNIVRCGGMLYGINCQTYNGTQNVVSMRANVLQQYTIKTGECVGYGATYTADKERKIAIISAGYGDGIMRSLSNRGCIMFYCDNVQYKAPIVGNISMDLIACDTTNIPEIKDNNATILDDNYTINDMARDACASPYEILINITRGTKTTIDYV